MDTWSAAMSASWCTARVCDGSVAEVAALLQSCSANGARFEVPGAALELRGGVASRAGVTAVAPSRVHRARVRYAPWLPAARVTVEVEPWSSERSEVLVRPGRRLAGARDRYLGASAALLEAVVAELGVTILESTYGQARDEERLPRAS